MKNIKTFINRLASMNPGDVQGMIDAIGFDQAVQFYADLVRSRIPNDAVRWQFVLEELDGASQGNDKARAFVKESGVPAEEYSGALHRSWPEVDGPEGPQQLLRLLSLQLIHDQDLMIEFTISVVRLILEDHRRAGTKRRLN